MATEYQFTHDWFSKNAQIWRSIFSSSSLQPRRILEVGSYEGRSACFLLEEFPTLEELVCVDPWQGMAEVETRFDGNILIALKARTTPVKVRKVKDSSLHALATLISQNEKFDLIYIDGSHKAPDVLADSVNAFHLLRVGGILILDDYLWTDDITKGKDILNLPKIAIDSFVNIFHRKLALYNAPLYQLYAQKLAD